MNKLPETGDRPAPHRIVYDIAMALTILALGGLLAVIGFSSRSPAAGPGQRWGLDRSVDTLVGTAALWAGAAVVIWWAFSLAVALAGAAMIAVGRQTSAARLSRFSPAFMQRLALAVLGLNLTVVPAAQAATTVTPVPIVGSSSAVQAYDPSFLRPHEREQPAPQALDPGWGALKLPLSQEAPRVSDLDPGWTPRPSPGAQPGLLNQAPRADASAQGDSEAVVRPGDSLWSVVRRHLGDRATDAEVARDWPRWYQENKELIGGDPDLILPGMILTPPVPAPQIHGG
ncbi:MULTISPECIES: LysM domain-containing protein [Arthrobacter]|uniref:LysM domain-containing protein n=2 Tax=Arthrobacter TaxID=1663 RepID=A0ABU9KK01_9MICC|nr:LysM domain-containing protein [Arthrobacter sp. YJM1]MDP5227221.1 LysM domain-containing protein [Arthrobacter sp. YJM1]